MLFAVLDSLEVGFTTDIDGLIDEWAIVDLFTSLFLDFARTGCTTIGLLGLVVGNLVLSLILCDFRISDI